MQGTIQRIQADRGFGFIRDVEGGDVFFHHTSVTQPDRFDALEVGMMVEFEPEAGPKGPRASKIRVVSAAGRHLS